MNARSNSVLCAKWLKCLLFVVTTLIHIRVCFAMLIKANELMHIVFYVLLKYFAKCYNHISVSQLGYIHLSHVTPPVSTSGETSPALQVLLKGSVVKVLLVRC
jgi:hypothetical protein